MFHVEQSQNIIYDNFERFFTTHTNDLDENTKSKLF
jgi:hypothetical protein